MLAPEHYNKRRTTLFNKKYKVIHSRNLKMCPQNGMILNHISRIIRFNKKHYWKEYVDFNTQMRIKSKSDCEKDFYKLMNDSVVWKNNGKDEVMKFPLKKCKGYITSRLYKQKVVW